MSPVTQTAEVAVNRESINDVVCPLCVDIGSIRSSVPNRITPAKPRIITWKGVKCLWICKMFGIWYVYCFSFPVISGSYPDFHAIFLPHNTKLLYLIFIKKELIYSLWHKDSIKTTDEKFYWTHKTQNNYVYTKITVFLTVNYYFANKTIVNLYQLFSMAKYPLLSWQKCNFVL